MDRSVGTMPLSPALMIVSVELYKSYPAESGDPRVGNVAFSLNFFTWRNDGDGGVEDVDMVMMEKKNKERGRMRTN